MVPQRGRGLVTAGAWLTAILGVAAAAAPFVVGEGAFPRVANSVVVGLLVAFLATAAWGATAGRPRSPTAALGLAGVLGAWVALHPYVPPFAAGASVPYRVVNGLLGLLVVASVAYGLLDVARIRGASARTLGARAARDRARFAVRVVGWVLVLFGVLVMLTPWMVDEANALRYGADVVSGLLVAFAGFFARSAEVRDRSAARPAALTVPVGLWLAVSPFVGVYAVGSSALYAWVALGLGLAVVASGTVTAWAARRTGAPGIAGRRYPA